jgi:hypothetical protein
MVLVERSIRSVLEEDGVAGADEVYSVGLFVGVDDIIFLRQFKAARILTKRVNTGSFYRFWRHCFRSKTTKAKLSFTTNQGASSVNQAHNGSVDFHHD